MVWFGESLDPGVLQQVYDALSRCDVILVCGTSGVVQPAASFPSYAKDSGAKVVEVNIDRTPISTVADVTLIGRSGEVLPKIVDDLKRVLG